MGKEVMSEDKGWIESSQDCVGKKHKSRREPCFSQNDMVGKSTETSTVHFRLC